MKAAEEALQAKEKVVVALLAGLFVSFIGWPFRLLSSFSLLLAVICSFIWPNFFL